MSPLLSEILQYNLNLEISEINEQATFRSLGADLLDIECLCFIVSQHCHISLDPKEISLGTTLNSFVQKMNSSQI